MDYLSLTKKFFSLLFLFLRIGCTAFGGPPAHLGFFRNEFVVEKKWLSEQKFADLVAICQFLPGPTTTQLAMIIGFSRLRYLGSLAAWIGFSTPGSLALMLIAISLKEGNGFITINQLYGLSIVAIVIVSHAVLMMAKQSCTDFPSLVIMTLSTGLLIHLTETWMQLLVMISSGLLGYIFIQSPARITNDLFPLEITKKSGFILITLFIGLLFGLSILAHMTQYHDLLLINTFYRAGALVFGGGHAVIAFLNTTVVNYHWLDHQTFITGYATVQAMPGPLFSFAGFLGASMNQAPNGFPGGIICLISIFLPGFLIAIGILPFWTVIKDHQAVRSSLAGIHASVVGMLAATLYSHFYLNSVHGLIDLFWIIVTTIALLYLKIKPWMLVIISMILSLLLLR